MGQLHLIDAEYISRHKLIAGNLTAPTAICALWKDLQRVPTPPEMISNIAMIGNLYTARGISLLLRGLWRNPCIRHLVLWGPDTQHTGAALQSLWAKGVAPNYTIVGTDTLIDKSMPLEAIDHLRAHVTLVNCRSIRDLPELLDHIAALEALPPHGPPRLFQTVESEAPPTLPSLGTGWQISDKTVATAWTRLLEIVMRFGVIKDSQYAMRQRELLNTLVVVTNEDANNPDLPEYLPLNSESLKEYLPRIIEDAPPDEMSYTYGNRLRAFFGRDQFETMVTQLRESPHTRRAVAVLWDPRSDPERETPPCLIQIAMNIIGDRLFLSYSARSQDIFAAWPSNTLGLCALQHRAAKALGLVPGPITCHTVSAHMYEHDWEQALSILKRRKSAHNALSFDPHGNFLIRVDDGKIVVELVDPTGQSIIWRGQSSSAATIGSEIASMRLASDPSHYVYLGRELQRAEEALLRGEVYDQGRA